MIPFFILMTFFLIFSATKKTWIGVYMKVFNIDMQDLEKNWSVCAQFHFCMHDI
jgi:hypothetical protein